MCVCFQVCPVLLALVSNVFCVYVFRWGESCWPWSVNVCMFSGVGQSCWPWSVNVCMFSGVCQSCWPWSVNVCMFSGVSSLVGLGQ